MTRIGEDGFAIRGIVVRVALNALHVYRRTAQETALDKLPQT
jgi:hypothetical protein